MTEEAKQFDGFGLKREAETLEAAAAATLPLQMRTAYAVGGISRCETVLSVTNLSNETITVEVEFFTGFNFFQRGIASLKLDPGETGELATASPIAPYVINAVRDSTTPFEGYANIHARTRLIGVQANMIAGVGSDVQVYEDINVFRPPVQHGD